MSGFVERVYCLETRISNSDAEYFKQFTPEFAGLCRRIWQDLKHGVHTDSKYVTALCRKYRYMKRTVNSALRQVKGRAGALKELTKIQDERERNEGRSIKRTDREDQRRDK